LVDREVYDEVREERRAERGLDESPRCDEVKSLDGVPREQQDNVEEMFPIPILERVANDDGVIDWRAD